MTKIFIINLIVFFLIVILIEIFFGQWFKSPNFGYKLKELINTYYIYESKFYEEKFISTYKRNSLAFRNNKEINPSDIKIIFQGGSTANEALLSESETIVGNLNIFLKKDKLNLEIINAGYDSKTTLDYVRDFDNWFTKIPNLNPKIVIFYTGINDVYLSKSRDWELYDIKSKKLKFKHYIANNSFFYNFFYIQIKKKYFAKIKIIHNTSIDYYKKEYKNLNFIDFSEAKKIYKSRVNENNKLIDQYKLRLDLLKNKILEKNITPIFITQFYYDGISTLDLYTINYLTKEYAEKNNFYVIKLDEMIKNYDTKFWFYDFAHTTQLGSKSIAKIIYPQIKNFLEINF